MAASASLTIPMNVATAARAFDARRILHATAGLRDLAFDAAAGTASFRYEFPGNIDGLMRRLRGRRLAGAGTLKMTVPVKNLTGKAVDPAALLAHLQASPAVASASFDGRTVTATIVAATNAMRYVYEEIIVAGLMPLDVPTVAGQNEFVL